jgi:hypothetical protein
MFKPFGPTQLLRYGTKLVDERDKGKRRRRLTDQQIKDRLSNLIKLDLALVALGILLLILC